MAVQIKVNGKDHVVDVEEEMPLLWVLRDELGLKGTKFGCGVAYCGACTVHVNGQPLRSCTVPVAAMQGQEVTTIEGLADTSEGSGELHPVQQAWIEAQVPQCGYCQSGMIMAVAALLERNPNPTDEEVEAEISNVCRCGTYQRIRDAVGTLTNA